MIHLRTTMQDAVRSDPIHTLASVLQCSCSNPNMPVLRLILEDSEYLISNMNKPGWRDDTVMYMIKDGSNFRPLGAFDIPANNPYKRITIYAVDSESSYTMLSVRSSPRLCEGKKIDFTSIIATHNPMKHIFEASAIRAIVKLDVSHMQNLTGRACASEVGYLYELTSENTILVARYENDALVLQGQQIHVRRSPRFQDLPS